MCHARFCNLATPSARRLEEFRSDERQPWPCLHNTYTTLPTEGQTCHVQVRPWPQPEQVYTVELFTSAAPRSGIVGPAHVEFHGRTGCTGRHRLESIAGGFVTGGIETCSFQAHDTGVLGFMLISHEDPGA